MTEERKVHPSVQRAREILEQREQQEAEYAKWRSRHAESDFYDDLTPAQLAQPNIIYKTYNKQPEQQPQQQQRDWSAWDRWCEAHIAKAFEEKGGTIIDELVSYLHDELAKRDSEIASLRADLTIATAVQRGEIKQLKKNADAA